MSNCICGAFQGTCKPALDLRTKWCENEKGTFLPTIANLCPCNTSKHAVSFSFLWSCDVLVMNRHGQILCWAERFCTTAIMQGNHCYLPCLKNLWSGCSAAGPSTNLSTATPTSTSMGSQQGWARLSHAKYGFAWFHRSKHVDCVELFRKWGATTRSWSTGESGSMSGAVRSLWRVSMESDLWQVWWRFDIEL